MRNIKWVWVMVLAMLFVACGVPPETDTSAVQNDAAAAIDLDGEESADTGEADEVAEADAVVEVTEVPQEVVEESAEEESESEEETDTAEESGQTSAPEGSADVFPAETPLEAVQERSFDHAKGADEPVVTVIEYGDFQ